MHKKATKDCLEAANAVLHLYLDEVEENKKEAVYRKTLGQLNYVSEVIVRDYKKKIDRDKKTKNN